MISRPEAAKGLKRGVIQPSGLGGIVIRTKQTTVTHARIVPRVGYYVVEVVYERKETQAAVDPALVAAIDIGVNNLAALTSNKVGFLPRLVNGRPLKSTKVKRGLYRASGKRFLNVDVNGSYNILRKASPDAFGYQPDLNFNRGYADDFFSNLKGHGVKTLANMGCPEETSSTFITGGCPYAFLP